MNADRSMSVMEPEFKPTFHHKVSRILLISLAAVLHGVSPAATIRADFTDGAGSSLPDQYPGIAGNGWSGGWASGTLSAGGITSAIQTMPPLGSRGNHLRVAITSTNIDAGIGRAFLNGNGTNGVDGTKPLTFGFSVRLDSTNSEPINYPLIK